LDYEPGRLSRASSSGREAVKYAANVTQHNLVRPHGLRSRAETQIGLNQRRRSVPIRGRHMP
jgi:hypothetical protein